MKLPNCARAFVPREKVTAYLLSSTHRLGRSKAAFFTGFGFTAADWRAVAEALLRHAADHEVAQTGETPFGIRYVVDGIMAAPDGRTPNVRTVWFIETGEDTPRFVTAYPLRRRSR